MSSILIFVMFYFPVLVAFVLGTVIGSLSNVIIYRLVYYRSSWTPPSHCTSCGTEIPWYLNIPLITYLTLRGKCRFCGATFSSRYFWVELTSGLMYALIMVWIYTLSPRVGMGLSLIKVLTYDFNGVPPLGFPMNPVTVLLIIKGFIFATMLLILAMIDLEHKLLPNRITVPGFFIGILTAVLAVHWSPMFEIGSGWWSGPVDLLLQSLLGALIGGGLLFLIAVLVPAGMGMGDIKLMAMVGAFVGARAIGPSLFMGFVFGGVIAILLMVLRKKKRKDMIPFGPFLALGGFLGYLWGPRILAWYVSTWSTSGGS